MSPTLDNTLGTLLIGAFLAAILYGFATILVFIYYTNYANDLRVHKISVAILWILDSLHLLLTIYTMYHYTIQSFGSYQEIQLIHWSLKLQVTVNVVIILLVQTLYALRVWKLGNSHHHQLFPIFVFLFVAGGYAIGIFLVVKVYHLNTFLESRSMSWVIILSLASTTAIDVVLSGAMCYYLIKSRSSFDKSSNIIFYIIWMTLISGTLTAAASLACLIIHTAMPNNLVYLGVTFLITKLYTNSFIAMLNARKRIRRGSMVMGSGNANKMVDIPTVATVYHNTGSVIDYPIGTQDDNNVVRMKTRDEKGDDFDSTCS